MRFGLASPVASSASPLSSRGRPFAQTISVDLKWCTAHGSRLFFVFGVFRRTSKAAEPRGFVRSIRNSKI
jgi:hypothetical protein